MEQWRKHAVERWNWGEWNGKFGEWGGVEERDGKYVCGKGRRRTVMKRLDGLMALMA